MFLISNHSTITNLHIFVIERAELSSISVDSTNAKLSILNKEICSQIKEVKIIGHFEKYNPFKKKILAIHHQISERIFPIFIDEFNSSKYSETIFLTFAFDVSLKEAYFLVLQHKRI